MTETTALSEFREAVATALEGTTPSPSDATVYTDMVDAVSPPAYLLVWGSPWVESSTFCFELVRLDVVCIAGRVDPAPGIATLETMVATAKNRLRAARFPQVVTQPPARFDIGGVAYLAARLTVEVKLAIPQPDAPIEGSALLTVTATLTVAAVVVGAPTVDGAATMTAAAVLTVAGTVVGAPVIDGAATLTTGPTLTAAGTVVGGFSPADLPGLFGWWDSSQLGTITAAAGKVSSWAPRAGPAAAAVQGVAGRQPSTGGATVNGKNAVIFAGGQVTSVPGFVHPSSVTVYTVARVDSGPFNRGTFGTDSGIAGSRFVQQRWSSATDPQAVGFASGGPVVATGTGATATGLHLFATVVDSSAQKLTNYIDNAQNGQATAGGAFDTGTGPMAIGAAQNEFSTPGEFFYGPICAVVYCSGAHAAADLANMRAWAQSTWGTP